MLRCFANLVLASDDFGPPTGYRACALCIRKEGVPADVWCVDDKCISYSFVHWLCGGCMVGLLVVGFVPLLFLAMLGLCCFLRVTHKAD